MVKRKDNKNRVLKEGEYQRANGSYEFKWRTKTGKRQSVYAPTLEELREKELTIFRDILDGIRTDEKNITVNFNEYIEKNNDSKKQNKVLSN